MFLLRAEQAEHPRNKMFRAISVLEIRVSTIFRLFVSYFNVKKLPVFHARNCGTFLYRSLYEKNIYVYRLQFGNTHIFSIYNMVYFCSACSAVPRQTFRYIKTWYIQPYSPDIQTSNTVFARNIRGTLFRALCFTGVNRPNRCHLRAI